MLDASEEWAELDADGRPIPVDPWEGNPPNENSRWEVRSVRPIRGKTLTHDGPEPPHGILMDGETWVRVVPRVDDLGVRSADAIALEAIRDYETASAAPLTEAAGLARRCRERLDRALAEADRVARG